jgi:hypothetical protein
VTSTATGVNRSQQEIFTATGWRVSVLERTAGARRHSQDASLVLERPDGRLRAAAIDGVTPWDTEARVMGLDEATYAAQIVRASLVADDTAVECLAAANEVLHRPGVRPSRAQCMAGAVVVDLTPSGTAVVTQAGECPAFARIGRRAEALVPERAVAVSRRAQLDELRSRRPVVDDREARRAHLAEEAALLDAPQAWETAAIGRFAEPRLHVAEVGAGWDELVLASDGAGLDARTAAGAHLLAIELSTGRVSDDLTLIRVRRG